MEKCAMMKGKTVLLGVSGGIAAYKAAYVASGLVKLGCDVHVILTEHAVNFINPITFETLTGNKCPRGGLFLHQARTVHAHHRQQQGPEQH